MGACCAKQNAVVADVPNTHEFAALKTKDVPSPTAVEAPLANQLVATEASTPVQSKSAIKVAVVVRPLLPQEKAKNGGDCIELVGRDILQLRPRIHSGGPHSLQDSEKLAFSFDRTYRGAGIGRQIFAELTEPLLRQFLNGFNATVFAYGQTGAGKTYTMGTALAAKQMASLQEESVIPKALRLIFDALSVIRREYNVTLKVSYVQIHEDSIKDLLTEGLSPRTPSITLREHPSRGVYMENANELEVKNLEDVALLVEEGNSRRTVAAHNLNEFSSRSHAVLQLTLEQRRKESAPADASKHNFLHSKLNLVDLAGSERAKETGTAGQQFSEGVHINKGLLALGNVIGALTEGSSRKHIPYRDSKLTRILQDSLGGTSETLMVACISPASFNLEQTINTLRYATRTRSIHNKLQLNNKFSLEEEVAFLRNTLLQKEDVIQQLRQELVTLKSS